MNQLTTSKIKRIPDGALVHKFGRNDNVGTGFVPVSIGGIYRTPQPASATTLRIKAGDANDAAGQSGARAVTVQGIDSTGALATEVLVPNGISAGSAGSVSFIRLFRAWVSQSGTYATASAGSHAAAVVIENSGGTEDWATISVTGFPRSQTEIGAYTVPSGFTAYLYSAWVEVDSTKTADLMFFKREGVLDAAAPYQAMRVVFEMGGVAGEAVYEPSSPTGPFPEGTDIGFMAKAASAADVSVDFEILLVSDT